MLLCLIVPLKSMRCSQRRGASLVQDYIDIMSASSRAPRTSCQLSCVIPRHHVIISPGLSRHHVRFVKDHADNMSALSRTPLPSFQLGPGLRRQHVNDVQGYKDLMSAQSRVTHTSCQFSLGLRSHHVSIVEDSADIMSALSRTTQTSCQLCQRLRKHHISLVKNYADIMYVNRIQDYANPVSAVIYSIYTRGTRTPRRTKRQLFDPTTMLRLPRSWSERLTLPFGISSGLSLSTFFENICAKI